MTYSDTTDCGSKGKCFKKEYKEFKEYEEFEERGPESP